MSSICDVRPRALAAVAQRRAANQTLREIDALLAQMETDSIEPPIPVPNAFQATTGHTKATPGPGAYNPVSTTLSHVSTRFSAYSGRSKKRNSSQTKRARTPGPGSYPVESSDSATKPRIPSYSFKQQATTQSRKASPDLTTTSASADSQPPMDSMADRGRTLVKYMPPTARSYRTFEQKQRIRSILAARTRWRTLGGASACLNHTWTEQRLGSRGIVPMHRQKSERFRQDTTTKSAIQKPTRAALNVRLRNWNPQPVDVVDDDEQTAQLRRTANGALQWLTEAERSEFRRTAQWQRARASRLLKNNGVGGTQEKRVATTAPARAVVHLPAHEMRLQAGRDAVRVRSKHTRVVTRFTDNVRKQRMVKSQPSGPANSAAKAFTSTPGAVRFDRVAGREDPLPDAHGVHRLTTFDLAHRFSY